MTKEVKEGDEKKWWIKPPRSSRICQRCQHKYSSHIDCRCLKLLERRPRKECECKGFISEKDVQN